MVPPSSAQGVSPAVGGPVLAVIGGAMMAVGPFLPWATLGAFSGSGLDKTGSEALIIVVFGVIGMVLGLQAVLQRTYLRAWGAALLAIAGGALAAIYVAQISKQLADLDGPFASAASLGGGVYATLLGAGLLLLGAMVSPGAPRPIVAVRPPLPPSGALPPG